MNRLFIPLMTCLMLCHPLPAAAEGTADDSMSVADAAAFLKEIDGEVISVSPAELPGLYLVGMKIDNETVPVYLDESGRFLISGNVIDLDQRKNLSEEHYRKLNPVAIDEIPLDDALLLGADNAKMQVIVFTDPGCPFCSKLHKVLHEAVKADPDLAFRIKLIPVKGSYEKVKTIICSGALEQLDKAFTGEALAAVDCETDAVDRNLALASKLGINGTPTLILPNGQMAPGYLPLDELLELIKNNGVDAK